MTTTPVKTIANFLSNPNTSNFLEKTLEENKGTFVSNLIAMCDSDNKLAACDPSTLMKCAMNATALNLPLNKNLGYAYVIAYNGVPSFQMGYKGFIQLAIRTGAYRFINAVEVRDGEMHRNKFTGESKFLKENPKGEVVGYVAYLELIAGFSASVYMTTDEIEAHAIRFSKSYQYDKKKGSRSSKWSDPLARPKMAMKTVLKALLGTYGVMSTEMERAMSNDNDYADQVLGQRTEDVEAEIILQDEPKKPIQKIQI
jgi:recombination protein RecT